MYYIYVVLVLCVALSQLEYSKASDNSTSSTNPATSTISAPVVADNNSTCNSTVPTVTLIEVNSDGTSKNITQEQVEVTAKLGILKFTLLFEDAVSKTTGVDKNLLFAPVSILGILATFLLGAESETKNEILNLLGFSTGKNLTDKENLIHYAFRDLFGNFSSEGDVNPAVKADLNQAIFYGNGTTIRDEFISFAQNFYKNEILNVNFNKGNEAADAINKWTANRTNGRIQNIIDPASLSSNTGMVLVNTLFFNGEWAKPFVINSTLSNFYSENSTVPVSKVKLMSNSGTVYTYYDTNFTVLGLPYKGENTFMYILLPAKGNTLRNVLREFKAADMQNILQKSKKEDEVTYMLPYMKLSKEIDLTQVLPSLGLKSIFDPAKANLSGIAANAYVSKVIHKANLDVTEAGSTGSAATSADISIRFPNKNIIVNKPFGFFIIHRPSGIIPFWGTVYQPLENAANDKKP